LNEQAIKKSYLDKHMNKNQNDGVSATAFAMGDNESQNMIARYDYNSDDGLSGHVSKSSLSKA
jgi:hypothetical protein